MLGLLLLMTAGLVHTDFGLPPPSQSPALLYTVAKQYEALAWIRGADRFSSGAIIFLQDASGRHPLIPGFAASADPAVSFDRNRVLFAGKQKIQDHWEIWEVSLDLALTRSAARRVTSCAEDCVRPFYLPDDRLVYAKKTGGRFVIEAADLAGGKMVQLTYGPGNSLPTDVLRDGRILLEATYPLGSNGTPELYTVYSDGSGVESYRCDHGGARHSGKQVASGDIVFTVGLWLSPVHLGAGAGSSYRCARRRVRGGRIRNFVGRLVACVAAGCKELFPGETLETGRRQFVVGGCGPNRQRPPTDPGRGTHGAEAASLGLA
jgi:hypothetical protein